MRTDDFNYSLPTKLIAQKPIEPRDQARLMVLNRCDKSIKHNRFFEIVDLLQAGDVLVFNDSRVIPARLSGKKIDTEAKVEILLLRRLSPNIWETLVRPGKRIKIGSKVEILDGSLSRISQGCRVIGEVIRQGERGVRVISFSDESLLYQLGRIPLPPYIHVPLNNPERYQTVYANAAGSIAAPTAGLHFTVGLIDRLKNRGILCLFVTLHVGLDTFQPVHEDNPQKHTTQQEYGILNQVTAKHLSQAKAEGRRIICVGTTTVRLVEAVAQASSPCHLQPFEGWVNLFILPGHNFIIVDGLVTNFHLPKSTLLMLVSAFASKDFIDQAYQEALTQNYRFYSFGDAMLVL